MINELIKEERMAQLSMSTINNHGQQILSSLENGEIDPLTLALQVKYLEELIDVIKTELRDHVINACDKYSSKEQITKYTAEFKIKEAGSKYDYSQCNDPIWNEQNEMLQKINNLKKERESFLRQLKEKLSYIDEETGEIVEIYPPHKTSTTTYTISIPKG